MPPFFSNRCFGPALLPQRILSGARQGRFYGVERWFVFRSSGNKLESRSKRSQKKKKKLDVWQYTLWWSWWLGGWGRRIAIKSKPEWPNVRFRLTKLSCKILSQKTQPSPQKSLQFFFQRIIWYIWVHYRCLQTHQKRASDPIPDSCELSHGCWDHWAISPAQPQQDFHKYCDWGLPLREGLGLTSSR
jgi:hypothetical protein